MHYTEALNLADSGDRSPDDPVVVLADQLRKVYAQNAKLNRYIEALEEQCDSVGLQKAMHAADMQG